MKKIYYSLTILIIISMIGLASALYSGETYTNDLSYEIINCSIINNTYNLDGLNLTWDGATATIKTVINYQPDTFILSCWVNQSYEIVEVKKNLGGWGRPNKSNLINQTNVTNANNTLFPIINLDNEMNTIFNPTSDELNKETKSFFESINNFFSKIFNWFKRLFK